MSITDDFNLFWRTFPKRVGKLDAQRAYEKARKRATAAEIYDGIAVYVATKPDYADWCHPATWLNKGRWMDEAPAVKRVFDRRCPHTPPCENPGTWRCWQRTAIETARRAG